MSHDRSLLLPIGHMWEYNYRKVLVPCRSHARIKVGVAHIDCVVFVRAPASHLYHQESSTSKDLLTNFILLIKLSLSRLYQNYSFLGPHRHTIITTRHALVLSREDSSHFLYRLLFYPQVTFDGSCQNLRSTPARYTLTNSMALLHDHGTLRKCGHVRACALYKYKFAKYEQGRWPTTRERRWRRTKQLQLLGSVVYEQNIKSACLDSRL
jgi:hypothetical protein